MKRFILFAASIFLLLSNELFSQPGNLDPSFGIGGIVTTKIGSSLTPGTMYSGVKQSDDKIVAVGEYWNGYDADFLIVRYNPDGDLDTSFGINGIVTTQVGVFDNIAKSAVIQIDGKIVVAGSSFNKHNTDVLIIRYNTDGSIDNLFGINGIVITHPGDSVVGGGFEISSIALQSDGKILAAGSFLFDHMDCTLIRYNPDGTLDDSFGVNGIVISGIGNQTNYINSIAVQGSGKIVAVGYSNIYASIIVRYDSNGTLDSTFGTNGLVTPGTSDDHANSVTIQNDQKIVIGGDSRNISGDKDFTIIRMNPDGVLDSAFGKNGITITDFDSYDFARSIAIQSDGKIVAAGESGDMEFIHFAVSRYITDGNLDSTFGINGKVKTVIGPESVYPHSVMVQGNGKIVVAGESSGAFALARYTPEGALDDSFLDDGIVKTFFMESISFASSAAIQTDGKIAAAGVTFNNGSSHIAVARYFPDATLDNTFGANGIVISEEVSSVHSLTIISDGKIITGTAPGFSFIRFNADGSIDNTFGVNGVADLGITGISSASVVQNDGKMITAGESGTGIDNYFTLVRYDFNGSLDESFGNDGIAAALVDSRAHIYSIAVQNDGKIVAAGQSHNGSNYDFVLVRYNANGYVDSTFGINGFINTQVGISDDWVISVKILGDGKILAAGETWNGENQDIAAVRYLPNGDLDSTFGINGIASTSILTSDDYCRSLAVQSDGKIIAAGNTIVNGFLNTGILIVRFNSNGAFDNTFGTSGIVSTKIGTYGGTANSIVIQPDGKIIAAGASSGFTLVRYLNDSVIPVELNNFTAAVSGKKVLLHWTTSNESNTRGFEIDRASVPGEKQEPWEKVGFIETQGTSAEDQEYTFIDEELPAGVYKYRLKQIDFDGSFKYYNLDENITVASPGSFKLSQNYPNPFNPLTTITYQLPSERFVVLKIYNVLGNEIAVVVNEKQTAGEYKIEFNGTGLSSGIYFYKITAGEFIETKKMVILR